MATNESESPTGTEAGAGAVGTPEPPSKLAVRMEKVVKAFGDNVVLDELDLEVPHGEKLVIMGPSGSGKTTILRVLMTLERPQDGVVWIGGEPLYHERRDGGELVKAREKHVRQVRKNVSMVFQHFNLFPHLTARENVTIGPRKALGLGKDEANERADDLLRLVGLAEKADEPPAQLSGGQKQRVAIARALAMRPQVVLFDEVTSALDPELVGEVLGVLRQIAEAGETTMILVTHEIGFAKEVADRVIMFDEGKVVEQAPPAKMFSEPEQQRTRDFLRAVLEREEM